nr:coatomer subunit gamma [Quercus suber]
MKSVKAALDMDRHEAGPSIHTVLTRQPMHRSSLLWDAPLEGEVNPTTGETEDDGVEDEYQLKGLEVVAADYMLKVGVSNFSNAWESMDMDPHEVGPSIHIVLMRQLMHRSSLLWDAPLESEEAPGVLTCRHRNKGLLEDCAVLDPRIAAYITDVGLDGLLRVPHMDLDHALITAESSKMY